MKTPGSIEVDRHTCINRGFAVVRVTCVVTNVRQRRIEAGLCVSGTCRRRVESNSL